MVMIVGVGVHALLDLSLQRFPWVIGLELVVALRYSHHVSQARL